MVGTNYAKLGFELERIVSKIFEKWGYIVSVPSLNMDHGYDISAEKNGKKLAIEVKMSRNLFFDNRRIMFAIQSLMANAEKHGRIPVLVIPNLLSGELKEELTQYDRLIIIDIHNLLFMVENYEELRNDLVSMLSFSVDKYKPIKPNLDVEIQDINSGSFVIDSFIERLKNWRSEDEESREYEKVCYQTLKILFADELSLWSEQQKSNEGLFRFDLICKIKDGNGKEFWGMAERYFNSKYIVFEFKNYSKKVTQKEIFTTEKYLYLKALRGIGILISANGIDVNANKAIRGILREEGKLIISLSNEDMINMLMQKKNNEEPADYLSSKLDELLIDLEK